MENWLNSVRFSTFLSTEFDVLHAVFTTTRFLLPKQNIRASKLSRVIVGPLCRGFISVLYGAQNSQNYKIFAYPRFRKQLNLQQKLIPLPPGVVFRSRNYTRLVPQALKPDCTCGFSLFSTFRTFSLQNHILFT